MIDGQAILEAIETKHGTVTADHVVEEARDADHPWHDRFDWNDTTAAASWRRNQARQLIRLVRFERRVGERVIAAPYYVRDPDAPRDEQAYVRITTLATDADRARAAVLAEFKRASSALKRAKEVAEVIDMTAAIEALLAQAEGVMFELRHHHEAPAAVM